MYRSMLKQYTDLAAIEVLRREAYKILNENHTLALAIRRRSDQRRYRSESVWIQKSLM
jgi:hypothetical protein